MKYLISYPFYYEFAWLMNRKKVIIPIFISAFVYLFSCQLYAGYADQLYSGYKDKKNSTTENDNKVNIELFSGNTMGTTYHIKVVMQKDQENQQKPLNKLSLHRLIEDKLKQVNQSMSVYMPESEISLFNRSDTNDVIKISSDFHAVMVKAQQLYRLTEGAWDGTVKPLVDLWGFGTKEEITSTPSSKEIKVYLQTTGFNQIDFNVQNKTLQKKNRAVSLDLGSIAKGFGVDAVSAVLKSEGYLNFLVEIGGEVFASGEKTDAKPWIVGISRPDKGGNINHETEINSVYHALPLKDKALATSGDYRRFTTINGKNYSHIIDPVTGYPVDNGVVSASVIADNCTFADGLATAIMVMGHEKGINLVNTFEDIECLIVVQGKDGKLTDYKSKKFPLP